MKILFDHCVPKPLRNELPKHEISTAKEMGWEALTNGKLLEQAETNGFEAVVTVDQNFRFQQNLTGRAIAVYMLIAEGITVEELRPAIPVLEQSLRNGQPGRLYQVKAR